jgi:hypothetical protein
MPIATHCSTHPQHAAVGACGTCGRPFCSACRVEDLAEERAYCSAACREAAGARGLHPGRPADELIEALREPIRHGWRLWARSAGPLTLHVALPVGLAYGLIHHFAGREGLHLVGALASTALGAAGSGVVLSRRHTGAAGGSPWPHVAARLVPWLGAWLVYFLAVAVGGLLILPGLLAGLRLFWADEFALVHGMGPVAALRESVHLTRGLAGRIFVFQLLVAVAENALFFFALVALAVAGALLPVAELPGVVAGFVLAFLGVHAYASVHAPEVVYFYGLRALRAKLPDDARVNDWLANARPVEAPSDAHCPSCGTGWSPADYRTDVPVIYCSACKAPLERPV